MGCCKDCKRWRHIRDTAINTENGVWSGPHGECMKIDEFSNDDGVWLHTWVGPANPCLPCENVGYESSLITRPDFGCNLFEEKE